jgi:outer membrane protein OmpA-like peptidoglycan-associated protein
LIPGWAIEAISCDAHRFGSVQKKQFFTMTNKFLILLSPFFLLLMLPGAFAQQSGKSKSKDRFREKDVVRPPFIRNAAEINGPGADFSPIYHRDGIVFISNSSRVGPTDRRYLDRPSFDMYFALLDANQEPMLREPFSVEMNSKLNEGQATFSRDGRTIYFTRNNMYKGVQKADESGRVRMKIYQARLGKYDWENVDELPFNDNSYSCMHPSLSVDGKRLYFASDMPGGQGGFDLYVSTRSSEGTWDTPVNLGPEINTEKNELFPFITFGEKTLFFASSGHNTLGGLDIFSVNLENIADGVVNLNEPYNSPNDDMGMILNEDGTRGFFTSDRPEGPDGTRSYGKADVYTFRADNGIQGVEKPLSNRVTIVVTDGRTGQPIPKAEVRVLQSSDDGFISAQNDFYYTELAPTPESPNSLSLRLVRKDADELGQPDNYTNGSGKAYADFVLYRSYLILASFDGYQTTERLYTMEPNKSGELTLSLFEEAVCHRMTGMVSTDKFNTRIPNVTLIFTHKESNKQTIAHTDLNGEYNICLPLEGEYLLQVKREGFRTQTITTSAIRNKSINNSIRLEPVELAAVAGTDAAKAEAMLARPLQDGYVITMDKINFEPGKATLNQSAVRHLDAIVDLMLRYPEMEIDLTMHTDSRGDAKANLDLTDERAKNAKTYLVYKGITADRINALGKGETQIRNRCTDGVQCTEAEHNINNRLEVKVRKVGSTVKVP